MADFTAALPLLRRFEGGYSNNPADRGGETYAGIARRYWKGEPIWKVIDGAKGYSDFPTVLERPPLKALLDIEIQGFYRRNFWQGLDAIGSQLIAEEVLDCGVNCSAKAGREYLQRALNFFGSRHGTGSEYPVLKVDGDAGPMTAAAADKAVALGYEDKVLGMQNALQAGHYERSTRGRASQLQFAHGWWERAKV